MHHHISRWNTGPVTDQSKTPMRGFRIPTELYKAAQAKAASEGLTISYIVRVALSRYVRGDFLVGSAHPPGGDEA